MYRWSLNRMAEVVSEPLAVLTRRLAPRRRARRVIEGSVHKPDLNREDIAAKRSNARRVKEFASNLNKINLQAMAQQQQQQQQQQGPQQQPQREAPLVQPPLNKPKPNPAAAAKRARALEFASKIPNPAISAAPPAAELKKRSALERPPHPLEPHSAGRGGGGSGARVSKLDELEAKHDAARAEVAAMRRELGM